jgi:hypothetical protein
MSDRSILTLPTWTSPSSSTRPGRCGEPTARSPTPKPSCTSRTVRWARGGRATAFRSGSRGPIGSWPPAPGIGRTTSDHWVDVRLTAVAQQGRAVVRAVVAPPVECWATKHESVRIAAQVGGDQSAAGPDDRRFAVAAIASTTFATTRSTPTGTTRRSGCPRPRRSARTHRPCRGSRGRSSRGCAPGRLGPPSCTTTGALF